MLKQWKIKNMNKGNAVKVTVNNTKMVFDQETFQPNKVIDLTIELSVELLTEAKLLGKGELFKEYCEGLVKMILEKTWEFDKQQNDATKN